jgi:hypothetical protein
MLISLSIGRNVINLLACWLQRFEFRQTYIPSSLLVLHVATQSNNAIYVNDKE